MISDRALARILPSPRSRALWGDLARALIAGLVIVVCLTWVAYYGLLARAMVDEFHFNDFGKFYYSARLFLAGEDMYGPSPATSMSVGGGLEHEFLNVNPPHFHLLLLPLAPLPPMTALMIWAIASLLSLAFCIRIVLRELRQPITLSGALWWLLALLSFAATGAVVITGQLSFLLLIPITAAWVSARRERWTRAGLWIGLAMSVKPFLLIFVPYFMARRRWLAAFYAFVTVAGLFGVGKQVFGMEAHESWGRALAAADWPWAAMNGSMLGALSRWLAEGPYFTPIWLAPGLVRRIWPAAALVVMALTLWAAARDRSPQAVDRGFALLLVGALLISPLGWVYYLWLPLGPMAALAIAWRQSDDSRSRARTLLLSLSIPGLICPLIVTTAGQPSGWLTLTIGSAYFWGTLLLWCGLFIDWLAAHRALPRAAS